MCRFRHDIIVSGAVMYLVECYRLWDADILGYIFASSQFLYIPLFLMRQNGVLVECNSDCVGVLLSISFPTLSTNSFFYLNEEKIVTGETPTVLFTFMMHIIHTTSCISHGCRDSFLALQSTTFKNYSAVHFRYSPISLIPSISVICYLK